MVGVKDSRAVETYLRNFEGEKARYQEILEITLCYGVQCLSRTFSLKGITCNELRVITGYDAAKNRDFYVRNASHSIKKAVKMRQERMPAEVRTKPSHSWRDGEVEMPDFPKPSATVETVSQSGADSDANIGALYSLPPAFDEIDYLTKLLGKEFMDLAWKTFAGKKVSQFTTKEDLDEQFARMEQRKTAVMCPEVKLPVVSFAEFLGAYVTECVRQPQWASALEKEKSDSGDEYASNSREASRYARKNVGSSSPIIKEQQQSSSAPCAAMDNLKSTKLTQAEPRQKQRTLHQQPQEQQSRQVPRSLRNVQSKIQPELHTRRQKLLRVKKTQSQKIAEFLARARLTEYNARRESQEEWEKRFARRKTPIRDLTTGAAALEIADHFIQSPLMDKFAELPTSGDATQAVTNLTQTRLAPNDPLKEELYSTTPLDNSFLGCKDEPRPRSKSRLNQPRRNYNGWLGDFGPLHTKTVRPEWEEADQVTDSPVTGPNFEWNFEHLPGGNNETRYHSTSSNEDTISKESPRLSNDCDDGLSDALSETSDPAFRWLKDVM